MKYRKIGNTNMSASIVAFGAWAIGGGQWWGANPDDSESIRTIQTALDQGINLIDTAPAYGWGRSEQIVGQALKGRRDMALIATKCGMWWADQRGSFFFEIEGKKVNRCIRPDTIQIEIEQSLKRLDTDRIDLYQTHWPSMPPDQTPIADTMACLMKLKDQGKILHLGVCNVTVGELKENLAQGIVVSDQFRYSMIYRDPEKDILPFCQKNNLATLTYMSLEQGLLTGKVTMDRQFGPGEFRNNDFWNPWFLPPNRKRVLDMLAKWKDLTGKYRCTLAQLVIAWTAAQPGVTHILCGMRNLGQLSENAKAGDLNLEAADVQRIRKDVVALGEPAKV